MSLEIDAASLITDLSQKRKQSDVVDTQTTDSGYATKSTVFWLSYPIRGRASTIAENTLATQSTSPESKPTESFPREPTAAENKARPVPSALPPLADLAEFDKPVDHNTLSRFRDVHTQIEKPLLTYMRRKVSASKYRPIALRLMILGRNEDDAKPCIVAFCPEEQRKRVRKFFDKSSIKALCQPEDDALPSFDVFVLGRALEAKHANEDIGVFIPIVEGRQGYTDDTYCGAPIIIRSPSASDRRCTFGGIIKAVSSNGDTKLYGLTVGHVVLGDLDDDQPEGTIKIGTESLNNCELQLSDSESEDESDVVPEEPEETESLLDMDNPRPDSREIQHGDSGSWVVNEETLEVYGYVVAADSFGGGHVIPLCAAFQSIVASLGLNSVGLATTVDMATTKLGGHRSRADEPLSRATTGCQIDLSHGYWDPPLAAIRPVPIPRPSIPPPSMPVPNIPVPATASHLPPIPPGPIAPRPPRFAPGSAMSIGPIIPPVPSSMYFPPAPTTAHPLDLWRVPGHTFQPPSAAMNPAPVPPTASTAYAGSFDSTVPINPSAPVPRIGTGPWEELDEEYLERLGTYHGKWIEMTYQRPSL
ncbi:hypothetical protein CEP54_010998 [Fusarium duplospermum]|uniref:Uncharacterized protein n=1 Tax=Fusarium duplospermum TaxID=1325734 RepID=A0A428PGS2_9HYPO|nr:hypothetical protein CEP54_010998 [Fusarium duplospermum]